VRTLIWGAGVEGRAILARIRRGYPEVEVFGWLDDDPALAGLDRDGAPVLGPLESLPLLVELHGVQAVLAAIPALPAARRAHAEELAGWSGAKLCFLPDGSGELNGLAVGREGALLSASGSIRSGAR
jgi:FlaA1/EpsC-like NDP-sugar epimerase